MPRPPHPWYWKARRAWFTDVGGVRRKLAVGPKEESEAQALEEFHLLMAESLANPPVDGGDPTVASVVDALCVNDR